MTGGGSWPTSATRLGAFGFPSAVARRSPRAAQPARDGDRSLAAALPVPLNPLLRQKHPPSPHIALNFFA
jgi:hypothetical protein